MSEPSSPTESVDHRPGLFPSREQRLVLHAALDDGPAALDAYREWRVTVDIDADFDRAVFRLIPLLYDNLRRLGHQDDLTGRLKGAYRMSWARSHRLFEESRPTLECLLRAGVRVMAVKGAPVALQYYGNPALRPMEDVDFVVPYEQVDQAVRSVAQIGFVPWRPFDHDLKRFRHSMAFTAPGPRELDLHWHLLLEFCDSKTDAEFWSTARPFGFLGHSILAPDATRMLLHTIVHGLRWNDEPPVRWVPDSLMILRGARGALDWAALLAFARDHAVSRRLYLGLSYLAREFAADVPRDVLEALAAAPAQLAEKVERHTILRPVEYETVLGPLLEALANYPGLRGDGGAIRRLSDFSHFLRFYWRLRGRSEIPARLARGALRRARRAVNGADGAVH